MSDPVSNAEIEDVLSSIRRLVAGDREETETQADTVSEATPDMGKDPLTPEDAPASDEPDCDALVLTPSLRVEEVEGDSDVDAADPAALQAVEVETELWEADAAGEAGKATPEAELVPDTHAEGTAIAEPMIAEAGEEDVLPTFIRPLRNAEGQGTSAEPAGSDLGAGMVREPGEDSGFAGGATAAAPPEAALPRNSPRAGFHFQSLRDDDLADADTGSDTGLPELEADEITATLPETAVEPEGPGPVVVELDETDGTTTVDADDLGSQSASDPADAPTSAFRDDPWDVMPAGEPQARSLLDESAETEDDRQDAGESTNLFSAVDAALDEEALRDLVSELLQRELQGALGERITRNVRKLVRREIHRALATRDFN